MNEKNAYPCGYAPRALRRLPRPEGFEKVLFVGAKDGSVTVLCQKARDQAFQSFHLPCTDGGKHSAAVRVLLEWGQDHLLVGRDNGRLDLVQWRDAIQRGPSYQAVQSFPPPPRTRVKRGGEFVCYATWLDENQGNCLDQIQMRWNLPVFEESRRRL